MEDSVAARLARVRGVIAESARRSARPVDDITLVAVTKTVSLPLIRQAVEAGQLVFGENRVQEGAQKIAELHTESSETFWHLVGHLQRNKARQAAEAFSVIESVDSLKLAVVLNEQAGRSGRRLPVLLQVNVAEEVSKSGFSLAALPPLMPDLLALSQLDLRGFMTIAPLVSDAEEVRWVFKKLRELRDHLNDHFPGGGMKELSMGMSGDFEVAIQEGATMVRIGRAIFGARPAKVTT